MWVPVKDLRDRTKWSAGWKQREDFDWEGDASQPGGAIAKPKGGAVCPVCGGEGKKPCSRKGCKEGLAKVQRQLAVIEKTQAQYKQMLKDTKGAEDQGTLEMRRRVKRQLKMTSKVKAATAEEDGWKVKKGQRRKQRGAGGTKEDEDWGARARSLRDEKLDEWLRGVSPRSVNPDDQQ